MRAEPESELIRLKIPKEYINFLHPLGHFSEVVLARFCRAMVLTNRFATSMHSEAGFENVASAGI